MKSHRALFFLTFTLILLAGIVIVGFSRGWFEREIVGIRSDSNTSNGQDKNAEPSLQTSRPKELSELLNVDESELQSVAGITRPARDLAFADRDKSLKPADSPLRSVGLPQPISADENPQVKKLIEDLKNDDSRSAASSTYVAAEKFDPVEYEKDPDAFLSRIRPSRVYQTASHESGATPIKADSSTLTNVISGESVIIRIKDGIPGAPLTLHCDQYGSFENKLKTISKAFDENGFATAVFKTGAGSQSLVRVLVASPVHSNQLRFVIRVLPSDSN